MIDRLKLINRLLGRSQDFGTKSLGMSLLYLLITLMPVVGQESKDEEALPEFRAEQIITGFDVGLQVRRGDTWIPFTVILANDGEAISGRLVVKINQTEIQYYTPVEMAKASKKAVRLAVFPVSDTDEFQVIFEPSGGFFPIELTPSLAILSLDPLVEIIAVLSPQRASHNRLGIPATTEGTSSRRIAYPSAINLPEHWPSYEGIDALIWDGGGTEELTPAQYEALNQWIQMGGHLVLALGERWKDINDSAWGRFLPLVLDGSEIVPSGTRIEWPGADGPVTLNRDVVIATSSGSWPADVVAALNVAVESPDGTSKRLPLLLRRQIGAGTIDTLMVSLEGTDPLFAPQEYETNLIDVLTRAENHLPLQASSQLDTEAERFLRTEVQAELPSAWFIAGFLGLYIFLVVPVNYLIFKKIGRLEWAWFMVPVWAIVFAVAAYYIGAIAQRGTVTLAEFSLVEASPSASVGRASTMLSLYSPVRQMYYLKLTDQTGYFSLFSVPTDLKLTGTAPLTGKPLSVCYEENAATLERQLVFHWSQRTMKVMHQVNLGEGIEVDVEWSGGDGSPRIISGRVRNHTPYPLRNVRVLLNRQAFTVGNIEPGAEGTLGSAVPFDPLDPQFMMNIGGFGMYGGRPPGMGGRGRNRSMPAEYTAWRQNPQQWLADRIWPMYCTAMESDPYGKMMAYVTAFVEQALLLDDALDVGRTIGEVVGRGMIVVPFTLRPFAKMDRQALPPDVWRTSAYLGAGLVPGMESSTEVFVTAADQGIKTQQIESRCQMDLLATRVDDLMLHLGVGEIRRGGNVNPAMYGMGMRVMNRGDVEPLQASTSEVMAIELQDWRTLEWQRVSFELKSPVAGDTRLRDVVIVPSEPDRFVDPRERSLRIRITNNSNSNLVLPYEWIRIQAVVSSMPRLPKHPDDLKAKDHSGGASAG